MELKQTKSSMKPAVIEQIMVWLLIFVGFATLLFLTMEYAAIVRLKSNNDTLAQQGARLIALGKSNADIAAALNTMKVSYYATIDADDIVCTEVVDTSYQIILNVTSTYTDAKVLTISDITAKAATFNETNSNEITCDIVLSNN